MVSDADLSNAYGVTGSPTIIINGMKFQGDRTPEGYKNGICTGFLNVPSECSQELSQISSTAGSC